MKIYHVALFLLLTALLAFLSACGNSSSTAPGTASSSSVTVVACPANPAASVSITNFTFQPATLAVAVNDIVKWTNNDQATHTVTSGAPGAADGKFDSGNLTQGNSVCMQLVTAGTYSYFCSIHPTMRASVAAQ